MPRECKEEEEEVRKAHLISQLWPFSRPVSKTEMNEMGNLFTNYYANFFLLFSICIEMRCATYRRPPKLLQIIDNEVKTRHQEEAFGGCL